MYNTMAFAVLGALGVFLFVIGIGSKSSAENRKFIEDENGVVRSVSAKDASVITTMLADFSEKIRPSGGNLESRLRKSGWVYKTVADYHARRMITAIVFGAAPIVLGALFKWSFLSVALMASGAAVFGFISPDKTVDNAIKKRKITLQREMGFGLERVSLSLTSGANISAALSSAKGVGSFGIICEKLAMSINTNRDIRDTIQDIKDDLPNMTQMDEFLELIRQGIVKGQDLVKPFQTTATILRDKLELEVVEAGQKAKIKITLLTSGFIVAASMLVAIGPILISIMNSGIF